MCIRDRADTEDKDLREYKQHKSGFFRQVKEITARSYKDFVRNPFILRSRMVQTVFITFLFSAIYFQVDSPVEGNPGTYFNRLGACFLGVVITFMTTLGSATLSFPAERPVFLREINEKMYDVGAYFLGRSSIETPFALGIPIIFAVISYYIVGLNPGFDRCLFYALTLMIIGFAGNSVGLLIGCLFEDAKVAAAIAPLPMIPLMLFSGFYANAAGYPDWIGWIQYISPMSYATQALAINEFKGTHDYALEFLGFESNKWLMLIYLTISALVARFLAFIFLKILVRNIQ
eukprot:TRINITY_DN17428_c0_g1_i1.p1 TRINITY_DN17428_c0_g1~~TRINITY_DN17428_c0_g1_i1.p1  ORF type:complete len:310 (-),score=34.65 TRINITY_DN17428_c0_g1_i1:23-889(-)